MRLQRPEYLGGGSTPVIINPIAQTFSMEGSKPLGELAAYGVRASYSSTFHIVNRYRAFNERTRTQLYGW